MQSQIHKHKTPSDRSRISFSGVFTLLAPVFKQHRLRLIIGFTALLIVDFLQLLIPKIIERSINGLTEKSITQHQLLKLGLLIAGIAVTVVLLRFVWRSLIIGFSRLLERKLRNDIFSHILGMDSSFFSRYSTGELMAHSSNDLTSVQMACGMGMVAAVDAVVMSTAAIGFMLAIDVRLTFFALLPLPLLAIATRYLSKHLHQHFSEVQEKFAGLTEFSRSTILAINLIKAYTLEKLQTAAFDKLGRSYVKSNMDVAKIQGVITPLSTLTGSLGILMVLYFGGRQVIAGTINLGGFVAFISYLYMLIWPMIAIGWVTNLMQRGLTSLGRVEKILESSPKLPQIKETDELPATKQFSTSALTFSYPESQAPAIQEISLKFGAGLHGITGRTGSGKSTLCRLLARLYPVNDGMLFLGDKDVNTLPVSYVREQLAYVSQEPLLFSDTIRANIAYAKPDATDEEVAAVAKTAAVEGDILALADGYESRIGERGVKLSGGQRQRIALARALLSKRPVLLIDDGLSAIDVSTEYEIFQNLRKSDFQTIIFVSNRIKLLSMMETIYIMDNGQITASGNHQSLLSTSSFYKAMYDKQMEAGDA